jgi:hypothetical protein
MKEECPYLWKCDFCGNRPPCIYKIQALKEINEKKNEQGQQNI